MLDSFLLSHREVVVRDERRRCIEEFTFRTAMDLAVADLDPPDRTILENTHSVGDNMAFYGLWVRQHLRSIRARNKALGNTRLAYLDEKLLQVILLHKLMRRLNPRQSTELRVAHHTIGVMIQKDLTLLLAEIRLEQWNRIFHIWKLRGISVNEWQTHIAGASAANYTTMTLAHRPGARIFLPTGHEDVNQSTDLFWLERGQMHAVSVKCVTGQQVPVRAWRVDALPHNGSMNGILLDQRAIFLGAGRFTSSEGRFCIPVLVHVAKPEGGPVPLNQNWSRLTWPDELLDHRQWTNHEDSLDLTR